MEKQKMKNLTTKCPMHGLVKITSIDSSAAFLSCGCALTDEGHVAPAQSQN